MESLIALHGFLGNAKDFDFLKSNYNLACPNLNEYVSKSFDELSSEILNERKHLLGYSFGARLGARMKVAFPHKIGKLVLLGGHLGLQTQSEKDERIKIENVFIEQIKKLDQEEFYDYWNGLDLFKYDKPIDFDFKKSVLLDYFKNFGLSNQPFLKNDLLPFKEDILFVYGEKDKKYSDYARKHIEPDFNCLFIQDCGHRILQHKIEVKSILRDFL